MLKVELYCDILNKIESMVRLEDTDSKTMERYGLIGY